MTLSIAAQLRAAARTHGPRPAVTMGEQAASYAEFDAKTDDLAGQAAAQRRSGSPIFALAVDHGLLRTAGAVAAFKAGLAYAPVDPALSDPTLSALFREMAPSVILSDRASAARFNALAPSGSTIVAAEFADLGSPPMSPPPSIREPAATDIAYLRLTSGSTGIPKMVTHNYATANFLIGTASAGKRFGPDDRVAFFNPFWDSYVLATLITGASLHHYHLGLEGFAGVGNWLQRRRITIYSAFPTAFRQSFAALPTGCILKDLRMVSLSGEGVTVEDWALARRHLPADCVFENRFACSELGQAVVWSDRSSAVPKSGALPIGRPYPGVEILLLDDRDRPVAVGEIGVMAIRCAYLSDGYYRRPDLTARSYIADPERPAGIVYRTGDLGRVDREGNLYHLGRADRQIKIRGFRVQPDEIEAALLSHPAIKLALVAAIPQSAGYDRLVAFMVANGEAPLTAEIRAYAQASLPHYMVPTVFRFLDRLPTTVNGKVVLGDLLKTETVTP